jgi:hypothetical protein
MNNARRPQVVFLGPSLSADKARAIHPDVVILPPAAMGDVMGILTTMRPHAIGIVDGSFRHTMAVFHKEILYAMEQGTWLLGASSMGALRAAECHRYGMIGVGEIYEAFADGSLVDDDEVAVIHAEEAHGFAPLSTAMVTIRATLDAMVDSGIIDVGVSRELSRLQKCRWFPDRSLADVPKDAQALGLPQELVARISQACRTQAVDPKHADAVLLLERMIALPEHPMVGAEKTVISAPFGGQLSRDIQVRSVEGHPITFDRIRRYATLHDQRHDHTLNSARLRVAIDAVGVRMFGDPDADAIDEAVAAIAEHFGVHLEALTEAGNIWDFDERSLRDLARSHAIVERMRRSQAGRYFGPSITAAYLDELRLEGRYVELKQAAALHKASARTVSLGPAVTYAQVIAALESLRGVPFPHPLADFIAENELGTLGEFLLTATDSVLAFQALFGLAEVRVDGDANDEGEDGLPVIDLAEPMMSRPTGV